MCKIFKFEPEKTETDKQIDIMQMNTAQELERASRFLDANMKELEKRKMTSREVSIYNNEQHCKFILKNLATDLKNDR